MIGKTINKKIKTEKRKSRNNEQGNLKEKTSINKIKNI